MPSRQRQWQLNKLAQGLCSQCGAEPHEPDRVLCAVCGEMSRLRQRPRWGLRRARGLCTWRGCRKHPKDGHAMCAAHRQYQQAYQAAYREKRRHKEEATHG